MTLEELVIRPFHKADQAAARRLILDGLQEHWGNLDETKNPDLDDVARSYQDGLLLVACLGEEIVGTGALIRESVSVGRIVRMSVAKQHRRRGVGRQILQALLDAARTAGYRRVVLETTATWEGAIAFYRAQGFGVVGGSRSGDGDMHFELFLENSDGAGSNSGAVISNASDNQDGR